MKLTTFALPEIEDKMAEKISRDAIKMALKKEKLEFPHLISSNTTCRPIHKKSI